MTNPSSRSDPAGDQPTRRLRPLKDTGGATHLEYALVVFVASVVVGFVLPLIGIPVLSLYSEATDTIAAVLRDLRSLDPAR